MSYCFQKSGSSSKPNWMNSSIIVNVRNYMGSISKTNILWWLGYVVLFTSCLLSYYLYLDKLYIIDEVFDVGGPRELTLVEKITIRVVAPQRLTDIQKFVLTYSVCPVVEEIQVVWNQPLPYPKDSSFKYAHTHSKVTFHSDQVKFLTITDSTQYI